MFDDDMKNDAIDAQIQQGIGRLRGNTLQGMAQLPAVGPAGGDNDADDAITAQMIAEDEAEQAKKAQSSGGGLGGMASSVMGMFGGG